MRSAEVLIEGLVFPEGPRWRENELWFVDMFGHRLYRFNPERMTVPDIAAEVPDDLPSGSGFLPDGSPILVLRRGRRIVKVTGDGLDPYAELGSIPGTSLNDMVVDESGRAYVGSIVKPELGDKGEDCIIMVNADGGFRIATSDVSSPNGMLISSTGVSLMVAETPRNTIVSFDILADGTLAGRRVVSNVSPSQPDGICGDAEGAIWVSGLQTGQFLRVLRDGQIVDRISVNGRLALACVLGGPKRTTLFMMTAATTVENARHNEARGSRGFVEVVDVSVPGAGIP